MLYANHLMGGLKGWGIAPVDTQGSITFTIFTFA